MQTGWEPGRPQVFVEVRSGIVAAPKPEEQQAAPHDASAQYQPQQGSQAHPAPAAEPPPRPPRHSRYCQWPRRGWLSYAGVATAATLLAGAIALIVLHKRGVLSSSSGADSYTPLPYFQRQRNDTAQPAFQSELHPWLLPAEQLALGLRPTVDVIIIGAGMAGLRAAQVLERNMTVLVLEARVSGACSSPPARHLAGRPSCSSGAHHLGLLQAQVLLLWVARCPHPRFIFALQDRVGGRILSLPFGGSGGVAELGAQFIWGSESGMDSSSQAGASGGGRGNPITAVSLAEPCVRQAVSTC